MQYFNLFVSGITLQLALKELMDDLDSHVGMH